MYLFVFELKVYCYPLQQTKFTFSQLKRKYPSLPSRNNTYVLLTTFYTTSLVPLAYSAASESPNSVIYY